MNELEIFFYFDAVKQFFAQFDFDSMNNQDVRVAFLMLAVLVKETLSKYFLLNISEEGGDPTQNNADPEDDF